MAMDKVQQEWQAGWASRDHRKDEEGRGTRARAERMGSTAHLQKSYVFFLNISYITN